MVADPRTLPAEAGKALSEFMLEKSASRRDLLIKIALVAAGAVGLGALVWFLLFWKPRPVPGSTQDVIDRSTDIAERATSGELAAMDCAALHALYIRDANADPTYLRVVVQAARQKGCAWAEELPRGGTV